MQATIFKIDRLNTHNGPGFRTVIYFKGCPLHCSWCHNPESINPQKEVWWNAVKCIGCGTCVEECPENAISLNEKGIEIDRQLCTGCQKCADVCPTKAIEKLGESYSVDQLMHTILQDKYLFESSGGGITLTGGEPGSYPDFIAELFERCKAEGIHTAFDTSGMLTEKALHKIIPLTDLVFLDIKLMEPQALRVHTGMSLETLKQSINWLSNYRKEHQTPDIEIHTPLVPQINDATDQLLEMGKFIEASAPFVRNWEWCLFNNLCEDKYLRLSSHWSFEGKQQSSADYQRLSSLTNHFKNLNISITGFGVNGLPDKD